MSERIDAQRFSSREQLEEYIKQMEAEGVRMGIDAAKHRAQMAVQQAQRAAQNKQPPSKPKKERD